MLSEHNPIAELIHQIQQKWIQEAYPFPDYKLIRWLIKPGEARLYEGFLKLESTEHGAIPEVLVAMLTPFKSAGTYSYDLISDWITAFENDAKTKDKLKEKQGTSEVWNFEAFRIKEIPQNATCDDELIGMLVQFHQQAMHKNMRLVVVLFPYSIQEMTSFKQWLVNLLKKNLPAFLSFMIFDHIGENYYDSVFEKYPAVTKSLHINLDLDGAVSKINKMGNPNDPEVQLRECILQMGNAVQKKDASLLQHWGEKALQVTQCSGLKSLYASAHIVYAGMLFNFKQFEKIDSLLNKGLIIARQGVQTEKASCHPLIVQFYGYMAASKQHQKKLAESVIFLENQGDAAVEYGLAIMALAPYHQAYAISKKVIPERYNDLIQKAYAAGCLLQIEEQLNSSFPAIALEYMQWQLAKHKMEEAIQTDAALNHSLGNGWKELAKSAGASYTAEMKYQLS
ncbi:MAG: hypothetical protein M3R72_03465 [Bacteroidota bacterium]|nr:hypothetical protein [Bacteroidota bacterium]